MKATLITLALATMTACGAPQITRLSGVDARIAQDGAFERYAQDDQQLVRAGRVRVGLDERAMWIAHGTPTFYWQSNVGGKWCRVFAYGLAAPSAVDTAIYVCNGQVRYISVVQPALPCWRVLGAGRRAVERAEYFDRLPLERQWQLLAGILERGQTGLDTYIAFGVPYNTGTETREDGTQATEQVFLDSSMDAYALYVTLVADQVVAWRFPSERALTPEAQQRRLDALEGRLSLQIQRQREHASAQQHRAEQITLGQINQSSGQMMETLAHQPRLQIAGDGPAPPPTATPETSGEPDLVEQTDQPARRCGQTLEIDGCTYRDLGDCSMGTACSNDSHCASGYTCTQLAGTFARCMPPPECG